MGSCLSFLSLVNQPSPLPSLFYCHAFSLSVQWLLLPVQFSFQILSYPERILTQLNLPVHLLAAASFLILRTCTFCCIAEQVCKGPVSLGSVQILRDWLSSLVLLTGQMPSLPVLCTSFFFPSNFYLLWSMDFPFLKNIEGIILYTLLYLKWITNKRLLNNTGSSAQSYVAAWMGRESRGEWIHVHVWLHPFALHLKLSQHC